MASAGRESTGAIEARLGEVVERARALRASRDLDGSVWPAGLPVDPWPTSWGEVWARLAARLDAAGEREVFVEQLVAHATDRAEHAADRALLLEAFLASAEPLDHATLARLGQAIVSAGPAYGERTLRLVRRVLDAAETVTVRPAARWSGSSLPSCRTTPR